MKKFFAAILAIAMLTLSAAALAEDTSTTQISTATVQAKGGQRGGPQQGGRGRGPMGQAPSAPVMIDFDAMVTKGVISQETCDKIKAYMAANKPADLPEMNGQAPTDQQPADLPETTDEAAAAEKPAELPEMNGQTPTDQQPAEAPAAGGLLGDLLKAGVITQAEYDALAAAQ